MYETKEGTATQLFLHLYYVLGKQEEKNESMLDLKKKKGKTTGGIDKRNNKKIG